MLVNVTPRRLSGLRGVQFSFTNVTAGNPTLFKPGDTWRATITGAEPNAAILVYGGLNADPSTSRGPAFQVGSTDSSGSANLTGAIDSSHIGHWKELWYVGNTLLGSVEFNVMPPNASFVVYVNGSPWSGGPVSASDSWGVAITGASPNSPVRYTTSRNGQSQGQDLGSTDGAGNWSRQFGQLGAGNVGTWATSFYVGNQNAGSYTMQVNAAATVVSSSEPSSNSQTTGATVVNTPISATPIQAITDAYNQIGQQVQSTIQQASKSPWWLLAVVAAIVYFVQQRNRE